MITFSTLAARLILRCSLRVGCLPALAVKLRFHLNGRDSSIRHNSLQWQDAFIDAMMIYQSDVIDVAFVAADSLQVRHVTRAPVLAKSIGVRARGLRAAPQSPRLAQDHYSSGKS